MRVVDSSAWIEWLTGSAVGGEVASHLPEATEWIVPTIVQFELMRWMTRERSQEAAAEVIAYSTELIVVPLDTDLATKAAGYGTRHRLAMADAIIYSTARHLDADLVTCDAHFEGLPGVVYLAKGVAR